MAVVEARKDFLTLAGMKIEVERRGKGEPLLLLHGEEALETEAPFVDALASRYEVIIPSPPGYGGSERPLWLTDPHDLAFVLHDLVDALKLKGTRVLGFSVGGWIAAEMATIDDSFMSKLVLVAPVGVKLGSPTDRDIADVWLLHPEKVAALKWHDTAKGKRDFASMPDEKLAIIARNTETTARFCWEPYMHNPKLKHRLHRINVPTLLIWGQNDGIVKADSYGKGYAELIRGANLSVVPNAGHLPHIEQPDAFMKLLNGFI
jgi:pimeloyl-ACP methyl ester carboxylesterase